MKFILIIGSLTLITTSCHAPAGSEQLQEHAICISDTSRKAASVYLTSDEKDVPVISWCETDDAGKKYFYMSYFDTTSSTFASSISIPLEQDASLHEEGMPKVAVRGDGSIVAVYETSSPTRENEWAGRVRYLQSSDRGKSWSTPRSLHADTTEGRSRSFASITRLGNGEIGACWLDAALDYKKNGRPVKFASTQGNAGFTRERYIDSVACECCRTAISCDSKGNISIVYRDIINDSIRDMSVSLSANNGQSFSPPLSFSGDHWTINGCPHNGPGVANAGNVMHAAWFTGGSKRGVYYGEMVNNDPRGIKKRLISSQGQFIQLCLLPDGRPVLAYNENMQEGGKSGSKIVLNTIKDGNVYGADVMTGPAMASYPVLRACGSNNILVAWKSDEKVYYAVKNAAGITTKVAEPVMAGIPSTSDLSHIRLAGSRDLVCGMSLSMSPADTAIYKGHVYGFCSAMCKRKFVSTPGLFVKIN